MKCFLKNMPEDTLALVLKLISPQIQFTDSPKQKTIYTDSFKKHSISPFFLINMTHPLYGYLDSKVTFYFKFYLFCLFVLKIFENFYLQPPYSKVLHALSIEL